jgi:hypothetical protein
MPVLANNEGEEIDWIGPVLHLISVIVGTAAVLILLAAIRGIGGKLGMGFKLLTLGVALITLGFLGYTYYEIEHVEAVEISAEIALIAGTVAVALGTKRFAELAK